MSDNQKDPFASDSDEFSKDDFNPAEFRDDFAEDHTQTLEEGDFATAGYEQSAASQPEKKKSATDFFSSKKAKLIMGGVGVTVAVVVAVGMNMSKPAPKRSQPAISQAPAEQPVQEEAPQQQAAVDPFSQQQLAVDPFAQQQPPVDPFAVPPAPGTDPFAPQQEAFVQQQDSYAMPAPPNALDAAMAQQPTQPVDPMVAQAPAVDPAVAAMAPNMAQSAPPANNEMIQAQERYSALQRENTANIATIEALQAKQAELVAEIAALKSSTVAGATQTSTAPAKTVNLAASERRALQNQINRLREQNRKLERIAKTSTSELEKIARGEPSDLVKAYQSSTGAKPSDMIAAATPDRIIVKAISKDLAVLQKGDKLHYVKQGDSFDGITVRKINPSTGKVLTNQGIFSTK